MKPRPSSRRRIPAFFGRSKVRRGSLLSPDDARMVSYLQHPLLFHRATALRRLEELGRAELAPFLLPLIRNRRLRLQSDAAVALGTLLAEAGRAPRTLRRLVRDPYWVTRIDALEALESIDVLRALPLIRSCLKDPHPIVRSYCAIILARTGWPHLAPALRKALLQEDSDYARVGLLGGLFELGDADALDPLLAMLEASPYSLRCAALNTLEELEFSDEQKSRVLAALRQLQACEPTRAVQSTLVRVLDGLQGRALDPNLNDAAPLPQ
jgi:HEAT repeat protein